MKETPKSKLSRLTLSDRIALAEALVNPPPPNAKLKAAFAAFAENERSKRNMQPENLDADRKNEDFIAFAKRIGEGARMRLKKDLAQAERATRKNVDKE